MSQTKSTTEYLQNLLAAHRTSPTGYYQLPPRVIDYLRQAVHSAGG